MFVKFIKRSSWLVVTLITSIILFLMTFLSIRDLIKSHILSNMSAHISVIIYIASALIIGYLLYRIKDKKYFLIGLFIVALIIRMVWILNINSEPVSDFTEMYKGAQNMLNGQTEIIKNSDYFNTWVYQLGFTFFQFNIIKLFGDSIIVLKITSAIISACIPLVIYLICKSLRDSKTARIPALIYCFYITSITMTSVLTNQHLSTLLIYFGLYILISKEKKIVSLILSGIIISIGNIIRPEGIIVIIAIVLFLLFKDFENIKTPKIFMINNIGRPLIIVIVYFLTSTMVSIGFKELGYTDYSLSNREPYWKFVVGLNPNHGGLWNSEDGDLVNRYPLGEDRDNYEKELILDRLKDKDSMLNLFKQKFSYMWAKNDWGSIAFSLNYEGASEELGNSLLKIEKIQFVGIIVLAFLSVLLSIIRKVKFSYYHLFMILLIGYILAHLIVEVQTRYRYFIIPTMVILSIEIFSYIDMRLKKKHY